MRYNSIQVHVVRGFRILGSKVSVTPGLSSHTSLSTSLHTSCKARQDDVKIYVGVDNSIIIKRSWSTMKCLIKTRSKPDTVKQIRAFVEIA